MKTVGSDREEQGGKGGVFGTGRVKNSLQGCGWRSQP